MACKKLITLMASGTLLFGSFFAATPASALNAPESQQFSSPSSISLQSRSALEAAVYPPGSQNQPQLALKAGKIIVKQISNALRRGDFHNALRQIPGLDNKAKDSIIRNSNKVADVLDEILYYADLPERAIREKLFHMLSRAGMDYGSAQLTAEIVANILAWAFF